MPQELRLRLGNHVFPSWKHKNAKRQLFQPRVWLFTCCVAGMEGRECPAWKSAAMCDVHCCLSPSALSSGSHTAGSIVEMREVTLQFDCDCHFNFCCLIQCQVCHRNHTQSVCKSPPNNNNHARPHPSHRSNSPDRTPADLLTSSPLLSFPPLSFPRSLRTSKTQRTFFETKKKN